MPAFSDRRTRAINEGLNRLHGKVAATKPLEMSYKAVKDIFVRPEHHELIETAKSLFSVSGREQFDFKGIDGARLTLYAQPGQPKDRFPFPNYIGKQTWCAEDHPELQRLNQWTKWRAKVGREFALSRWVFNYLNEKCRSAQQLAYLWPVVAHACKYAEGDAATQRLCEDLGNVPTPSNGLPKLPIEVKEAVRFTCGLITRTQLLAPYEEPATMTHVWVNLMDLGCGKAPLGDTLYYVNPTTPSIGT